MTTDKNRFVAEKLGLCWHRAVPDLRIGLPTRVSIFCPCGKCGSDEDNPDFSTDAGAVQLLRLMMERPDCDRLLRHITGGIASPERMILAVTITTRGKLLDAVAEWLGWKE